MEPTELAYLAGFFDGEGCVGIKRCDKKNGHGHIPYVSVSQVRPAVLLRFKELFRGNIYFNKNSGKNGIWCWQIHGQDITLNFLDAIFPYLFVKKDEAQVVMDAFREKVLNKKAGTPFHLLEFREAARRKVMGMR